MQSTLWLATPAAAPRFDPETQTFADRQRWLRMSAVERSRADWRVSRALLAHVKPAARASSLSHSGGLAALAVAPVGTRVGVDLEVVRERRDVTRLARFAFAPPEVAQLEALPAAFRVERFYTLWTLKEACIKALGLQLPGGLRECVFTLAQGAWQGRLPLVRSWTAHVYRPGPALYVAVMCLPGTREWTQHEWPEPTAASWPLTLAITTPE